MIGISITVADLKELLDRHTALKREDKSVSDCIELNVQEKTDVLNKSDKIQFWAQSVYAECEPFRIGQNFKNESGKKEEDTESN